jgi:hypothetical protein
MGATTRLARPAPRFANSSPYAHGGRIALREVGSVDVFPATNAPSIRDGPWRAAGLSLTVSAGSGGAMTDTTGPRVGAGIDALPGWQHAFCREVRQLATPPTRRSLRPSSTPNRPCFVLGGCIALRRGHRPRLRGDHHQRPCRQDRPHRGHWYGEAITASTLVAMFRLIIASDRAGGWRELKRQAGPAVTEFGSQPGDRVRVDTDSGVADIVLTSPAEGRVTRGSARLPGIAGIWIAESINLVFCPHACSERPAGAGRADA